MSISKSERFPTPAVPIMDDLYESHYKKMTTDQLAQSCDRLSKVKPKAVKLPPLLPKKAISAEDEQKIAKRLHDETMKRKQQNLERLIKARDNDTSNGGKVLTKRDQQALGQRLAMSNKMKVDQLREKYYAANPDYKVPTTRVVPADQLYDSLTRIYENGKAAKQQMKEKLKEKYITSTELKKVILPADQVNAASDRLFHSGRKS